MHALGQIMSIFTAQVTGENGTWVILVTGCIPRVAKLADKDIPMQDARAIYKEELNRLAIVRGGAQI